MSRTTFLGALVASFLCSAVLIQAPASAHPQSTREHAFTCAGKRVHVTPYEKRTLVLHNDLRRSLGLRALCLSMSLTRAARFHSHEEIENDYYEHCSMRGGRCYEDWDERIRRFGYGGGYCCGENLHMGVGSYTSPQWIFNSWKDSAGHYANIIDPLMREIGIGTDRGTWRGNRGAVAYTVDFGAR